ncbi:Maf family protein [Lachnoanaerobaculum sp. MSX33]|uniref:Maf family protein n=1 Tax=Lachnoanaerobaculum sp. MSX33 TaxID=936596 RepID=UPI002110C274
MKNYFSFSLYFYLDKKEPYDKAGTYAIQGYFSRYIVGIEGDYYNVMGLPIGRLYREHLRDYI